MQRSRSHSLLELTTLQPPAEFAIHGSPADTTSRPTVSVRNSRPDQTGLPLPLPLPSYPGLVAEIDIPLPRDARALDQSPDVYRLRMVPRFMHQEHSPLSSPFILSLPFTLLFVLSFVSPWTGPFSPGPLSRSSKTKDQVKRRGLDSTQPLPHLASSCT